MLKKLTPFLFSFFFLCQLGLSSQTTNQVTYAVSDVAKDGTGIAISFYYNCDGGPCQTGQFVTGDYWVAPNTPNGKVTITNITPTGSLNGAMLNADLLKDTSGNYIADEDQKQGILDAYDSYSADLDLMNSLPYEASGGDAIIKIAGKNSGCPTSSVFIGCVDSAAILTILSEVPQDRGATTFRPPFTGTWRPMFTTDKVMMDRLPKLPQATGLLGEPGLTDQGNQSYKKWLVPQLDIYSKAVTDNGPEFMRATIPNSVQQGYAADQAIDLLDDMFRVFGQESNDAKKETVYALIQKGIDNYGIFKQDIGFSFGAGQFLGKKPPIAFFAALYDDETILEDVRRIATDPEILSRGLFQEDSQIRAGKNGPIWGEDTIDRVHNYFSNLYPKIDNQGGWGDPFDYIDGPAGGIYDGPDIPGTFPRSYMEVSTIPILGYGFLQHLMPWFKYAAGDDEVTQFTDRFYDGYGIDNFDGGIWTLPDPVAPRDPEENPDCAPFKLYSSAKFVPSATKCGRTDQNGNLLVTIIDGREHLAAPIYSMTWGPLLEGHPDYDEDNPKNNYVAHDQDPKTYGRMPHLHGTKLELSKINSFMSDNWDELRPCSDPSQPSYPCAGLGSNVSGKILSTLTEESSSEKITITNSEELLVFKTTTSYSTIDLKIYSITGSEIINDKGAGNFIEIKKSKLSSGIYFYNIALDGIRHTGKISIRK